MSSTVAQTILDQLGSGRFLTMTGAHSLMSSKDSLTFSLSSRSTRDGINRVRVTLNDSDTYTVTFFKIRGCQCDVISTVEEVYNDMLRNVFTQKTGLLTSL